MILKVLIIVLLSSVIFGFTFPVAVLQFKLGVLETILWTNIGGSIGILIFATLSKQLIYFYKRHVRNYLRRIFTGKKPKSSPKIIFSRKSRRIVSLKNRYGLAGIAFITPVILSIPLGVFIIVRYFNYNKNKFILLLISNFLWSVTYTLFYHYCYDFYLGYVVSK